jgi:hypothetical protein
VQNLSPTKYIYITRYDIWMVLDCKFLFSYFSSDFNTKGVIRMHISKKNRQHNDQMKKYKRTNNDLQNIHIKLKIE